jgi:chromosome segregation ATPase
LSDAKNNSQTPDEQQPPIPPGHQVMKARDYISLLSKQLEVVKRSNAQLLQQSGSFRDEVNTLTLQCEELTAEVIKLREQVAAAEKKQAEPAPPAMGEVDRHESAGH